MDLEIKVPDIGDFKNVEIIEVLIKEGDQIKKNDPILTLESDKSSVEVPSPFDGKISSLKVKVGDKVSQGSLIATLKNVRSSPEKFFKVSLLGINRKVSGCFSLKRNTTVVFAIFCIKTEIDFIVNFKGFFLNYAYIIKLFLL